MTPDEALRAVAIADPASDEPPEALGAVSVALLDRIDAETRRRPHGFDAVQAPPSRSVALLPLIASERRLSRSIPAVAIAAAITIVVLIVALRDDDASELDVIDAPASTSSSSTTVAPDDDGSALPQAVLPSQTDAAAAFVEAFATSDRNLLHGAIAIDASCETSLPGNETCGSFWGNNLAIGARIELLDCEPFANSRFDERCRLSMTSELHTVMGYDGRTLGGEVLLRTDEDGRLIPFPVIDPTGAFIGTSHEADLRLWAHMEERYPELTINRSFGPVPYDYESGLKMLEAARELNDPVRIANEIAAELDSGGAFVDAVRPNLTSRVLDAIGASLTLDCTDQSARKAEVICPAVLDSDIHRLLGSEPVDVTVRIAARGGVLSSFDPDLRWFADDARHDSFIEFGKERGIRFGDGGAPVYNLGTVDDWLAAAAEFEG